MKLEQADLDAIADAVVAKIKAADAAPVPAKAAAKGKADKAQPAAEAPKAPAADGKKAPIRDDVHAALSAYSKAFGKDAALAILHEYSPTLTALPEDKFEEVITKLKASPAASESEFD